MPIYEYECQSCHRRFDVEQRFTDDALETCEECGGALRKVYSAVGVVFKGSGFYKTDSRSSGSSSRPASESSSTSSTSESAAPSQGEKPSPGTTSTSTAPAPTGTGD